MRDDCVGKRRPGIGRCFVLSVPTRANISKYLKHVIARLRSRFGDLRHTALRQLYLPSYEVVGRVWTPDLLEQFRKYRGYDMTLFCLRSPDTSSKTSRPRTISSTTSGRKWEIS